MARVLFIGGTGIISSACAELAVAQGHDLTLLTRGQSIRPLPSGITHLQADIRDEAETTHALAGRDYDVIVNWIAYAPEDVAADLVRFRGRTEQYIFISSASVYRKPPPFLPVTEEVPADNQFWPYAQQKIACEKRLMNAYNEGDFPVTIVRPSHTYDRTSIPFRGGYTMLDRLRRGMPILIHGDGTSLWTLTHHKDFARGFNGLLANPDAIGETVHITSDEWLTWDQIAHLLANAYGVEPAIVHVPSDVIVAHEPEWYGSLMGDKTHSMIFDNAKIKRLVPGFEATIPYAEGARETVAYYEANPDACRVDRDVDAAIERIIAAQRSAMPPA